MLFIGLSKEALTDRGDLAPPLASGSLERQWKSVLHYFASSHGMGSPQLAWNLSRNLLALL